MNTVFVYGLLKPGYSLFHVAEPYLVRSAPGKVRGRLYDAGVPAARFDQEGEIDGFIFWLDPDRLHDALTELDDLEDEGDVYRRVTVRVDTSDGPVEAHAYEYLRSLEGRPDVGSLWS